MLSLSMYYRVEEGRSYNRHVGLSEEVTSSVNPKTETPTESDSSSALRRVIKSI